MAGEREDDRKTAAKEGPGKAPRTSGGQTQESSAGASSYERRWQEMFERLRAFKKKNGDVACFFLVFSAL